MKTWSEQFISQGYSSGKSDGIKEGIKEGKSEGAKEFAKRLMVGKKDMSDEEISSFTDLSLEAVKEIRQSLKNN